MKCRLADVEIHMFNNNLNGSDDFSKTRQIIILPYPTQERMPQAAIDLSEQWHHYFKLPQISYNSNKHDTLP